MLECCSGMILSPRLYKEGFWNRIVSVLSCRGQVRLGEQKGDIFPSQRGPEHNEQENTLLKVRPAIH